MRGRSWFRSAYPGVQFRSSPASCRRRVPAPGRFAPLLCAAALSAALFLGPGCAKSMKVQRPETGAGTAEGEKPVQALQRELDEAHVKIAELERQIEDISVAREVELSASEQELAQVKQTYETLVKELKQEVDSGKIKIEQSAGEVKLDIAEELFFETGMADIKPEGMKVLLRIGKDLQKVPRMNIRVEGHTDNVPIGPSLKNDYPTNWELAAARAVNVVRFLQEKAGTDPRRLSAVSYAEYRPVASNKTESGKQRNRRVEIVLIDKGIDTAKKTKTQAKK